MPLTISERYLSYGIHNMYIVSFSLWTIDKNNLLFDPGNNIVSKERNFKFCHLKMKENFFRGVIRFIKETTTRKWEHQYL